MFPVIHPRLPGFHERPASLWVGTASEAAGAGLGTIQQPGQDGSSGLRGRGLRMTSQEGLTLSFQPFEGKSFQVGLCFKGKTKSVSSGYSVWLVKASPFPRPL